MKTLIKARQYTLPVRSQIYRDEGPQGYMLRLAENNLMNSQELKLAGIHFDYEVLLRQGLLTQESFDPELYQFVRYVSELWALETRVWNMQHARFCPHCLLEHTYWKVEWELNFYDVCHHHGVWLVDQCSSCGKKLSWSRTQLLRCQCGSILTAEQPKACPVNMTAIAAVMSSKIFQNETHVAPEVVKTMNIEQTQRLIRYLGNYMSQVSGKNPLKMRHAGDLVQSWPVTTLAAQVLDDWPKAFHDSLTKIEKLNRPDGRPSLNEVFGQAYHYVFKSLKEKPFEELRHQFELWLNGVWKGGIAKRNKRLTETLMQQAAWIPASVACDFLGTSHQRLDLLIREGTIEGETHISQKGRKFVMVRRDNLDRVKQHLFGLIDMTTAGRLLGLQKRRMRQVLKLIFTDAKKTGSSPGSPWAVSRLEVNQILELSMDLGYVSIPDEGCVSLGHILRYWTWSNEDVAGFIISVKSKEIVPINVLDTVSGIAAWNFNEMELKNWKIKSQNGLGTWLTIAQTAKLIGIKEQVAYELVRIGFLRTEVMPKQMKQGTRVRRSTIIEFKEKYIFATHIAEALGCSARKVISQLNHYGIQPISGPGVNGARQVLYQKTNDVERFIEQAGKTLVEQYFDLR